MPQKYTKNPNIGCWVRNQRSQCRLLKSVNNSFISDERTVQLEKLGYQWETKDPGQEKNVKEITLITRSSSNNSNTLWDLRNIPNGHPLIMGGID